MAIHGFRALMILAIIGEALWTSEAWGERPSPYEQTRLSADAQVAVSPSQAVRALCTPEANEGTKLGANVEISRGPGVSVYPKVAPATVFIQTPNGYGTGFIIGDDGWIVTNAHVVNPALVSINTGARMVKVFLGKLKGPIMEVDESGIMATVYKVDEGKDLALLKLTALPKGVEKLPVVQLAKEVPPPGSDCVVLGHPRAGMMWTLRSGEISGVGRWPRDMLQTVAARLSGAGRDAQKLASTIGAAPKRKILLTSCGINPGDSGGPLVDTEGRLIGVMFAIPRSTRNEGISLDKFSYCIHLDEVEAFIKDRPSEPCPYIPDPWPSATLCMISDKSKDKILDTIVFGTERDKPMNGYLIDLDQDTPVDFEVGKVRDPKMRAAWDFEFGFQRSPAFRAFYDTNNDGKVDVILTDSDGDKVANLVLKLQDGNWRAVRIPNQPMFDQSLFADKEISKQFADIFTITIPVAAPHESSDADKPVEPPATNTEPATGSSQTAPVREGGKTSASP